MSLELPKNFGRFEVKKLLGRGAMGTVYLAEDPVIGRQVAIKVLRTHISLVDNDDVSEIVERFEREFRSAGTLTHPNIVTVYDVGQQDEQPFIAMEYVRGESLESVLLSDRVFSFKEVSDLAAQLSSALDYAHERSIVHRDIKPANILMTWDGKAKVTDFGVAKLATSTMTRTGTIIGTPAYMAPEQVTGHPVSGTADQFSVAVILYELLTGERPFAGDSPTSILYKIVHEQPQPPRSLNRELPEKINQVLLRALAKDSSDRFDSCAHLARAVRAALGAAPSDSFARTLGTEATLVQGASEAIHQRKERHQTRGRVFWALVIALALVGLFLGWQHLEKKGAARTPSPPVGAPATTPPGENPSPPPSSAGTVTRMAISSESAGEAIWLDGEDTGLKVPATVDLRGKAGETRRLQLRRGDRVVAERTFTLGETKASFWSPSAEDLPTPQAQEEKLRIVSRPAGAQIILDGETLESRTPAEITVQPGRTYELRLEFAGHKATGMTLIADELSAEVREKGELFFPLVPSTPPGFAQVTASFPVSLEVGGRKHGPSTDLKIEVQPGKRRIIASAPEVFLRTAIQVDIESDKTFRVPLPEIIEVTFTAVPGNCRVSIDGREVDSTPIRNLPVAAGSHEIAFYWPGLDQTVTRQENLSASNRQISARPSS